MILFISHFICNYVEYLMKNEKPYRIYIYFLFNFNIMFYLIK